MKEDDQGRNPIDRLHALIGGIPVSERNSGVRGDCSIATGADSKIARQEQGETTWDPLNASELAPQLGERLDPKPNCVGQVLTAR